MRPPILLILMLCISCATLANVNNDRIPDSRDAYLKNKIAAGVRHTLEIRNGTLWAWGNSLFGQVGDGSNATRTTAVKIGTADNWVTVAAGAVHSLGIKADGTLWAWGYNYYGQLGDSSNTDRYTPVQVGTDNKWVSITAGAWHSIGVKADGTLWAWGSNSGGQLGIGNNADKNTPVQVGTAHNWVSIAAGGYHSLAVKADGSLWAWGGNNSGQLGNGSTGNKNTPVRIGNANNWMHVAAGEVHSMAIKANGTLWAWGLNSSGQLGDSTTTNKSTPVQIDAARNWVHIVAGAFHSLAIKANGTLWAWGRNDYGQLGDNTTTGKNIPVQIDSANKWASVYAGYYHSLGIKTAGSVMAWGGNSSFAQLGDGTFIDRKIPVRINVTDEWVNITAGHFHNLGIKADGTLWAWGWNGWGQLGDSISQYNYYNIENSPVQVGVSDAWVRVAAGVQHSLGIKVDGTLWSWGFNYYGELGDSTNVTKSFPVRVGSANDWVAIAAGYRHSLGIRADGTLWAWGYNHLGQLGNSTNVNKNTPVQIGTDDNWVAISTSGFHSMGLKADGTLWAWGFGIYGQLGNGAIVNKNVPVQIDTFKNWVTIAVGYYHSLGLKADGTVWAWGRNIYGQLGDSTTTNKSVPIQVGTNDDWMNVAAGYQHSQVQKANGTLWAWGWNDGGQLGDGTVVQKNRPVLIDTANFWSSVTAGHVHTLGISMDRMKVCATGYNSVGQLGSGDTTRHNTFFCGCASGNIYSQPVGKTLCNTGSTYFRIKAKYTIGYQWQVNAGNGWVALANNTIYSGVNTDSLSLTNITPAYNSYWYRCIVFNDCNDSTVSDSAKLTFIMAPLVTTQPKDSSICSGTNTKFNIGATGTSINYQWQVYNGNNWSNITGAGVYSGENTDTLMLTTVPTALNGYKYRCIVNNICVAADTSIAVTLTVDSAFISSVTISGDTDICAGQTANFTATPVNGGTNPVFQWQVAGVNAGTNSISFSSGNLANGNVVRCIMTSDVRCPAPKVSFSNGIGVQVTQNVTPTISITSDRGTSWCSGKENIFRSANTNGGAQPWYQWKINGVDIGPGADSLWVPYLNDGDVVECDMASSAKCPLPDTVSSNKINMTIVPTTKSSIIIMPNPDSVICQDEEITMYCAFTNGGTTPAFQWMLNGKDIPGAIQGTLKTTSLSNGDIVHCRFISSGTCVFPEVSNPVSFTVNPVLSPEVSITVLYIGNGQYMFTALPVNGGGNPAYRWYLNGKELKDEYNNTLTLTGLTRADKVWVTMASSECVAANMRLVSSKKITAAIEEGHASFKTLILHPNPNKGIFVVEGDLVLASVQEVNMTILNSIGQVMYREQVPVLSGKLNYTVTTKDLPTGGYLLKLDYEGGQDFRRFVITR